jgi:hypothetical protein
VNGRKTAHHVKHDRTRVRAGRDVEEHELVGALAVVAHSALDRVAGIAQRDELHPLDDAPAVDVEARDQSFS